MTRLGARRICVRSRLAASFLLLFWLAALVTSQDSPQPPDRVPDDAMQTLLIKKVNPRYPPLARQARIQGMVILKIVIGKAGNVQSLQLVKGHPMLAPAAFEAVRQWRYQPYLSNGKAAEVETNVQVNFFIGPTPAAENIAEDPLGGPPAPQSSNDPGTPKRVRVSESIMQALLVHKVDPVNPGPSAHTQNPVVLKAVIDRSGAVKYLQVVSGQPPLVRPAIEAAKQWKYQPFLSNGDPVEVETTVHVDFEKPESK